MRSRRRPARWLAALLACAPAAASAQAATYDGNARAPQAPVAAIPLHATAQAAWHRVPASRFTPLYTAGVPRGGLPVAAFYIAAAPVSNRQFLDFVIAHPEWRRSRAPRVAVDTLYLRHWQGDLELGPTAPPNAPVVLVSWFAANAYADWIGARLPTTAEWERAAAMGFARDLSAIIPTDAVWEWVDDFNSAITSGESRGDSGPDGGLFCAGGAALAANPSDYAAFLRYALRASLKGHYTLGALGFRLARDAKGAS